jgi:hypothetical protein
MHEQYEEPVRRKPELAIERQPDGPFVEALRLCEILSRREGTIRSEARSRCRSD